MDECRLCGGEVGLLGILGKMRHYLCRNCGAHFHSYEIQEEGENDD